MWFFWFLPGFGFSWEKKEKEKETSELFIVEFLVERCGGASGRVAEKCKRGRFIHYRILSLFWQMHFPAILWVKKPKLFSYPNYCGTYRGLYINFWHSEIQLSHMPISINSSALLHSDFKICYLMNNKNNGKMYMLRTINHPYSWIQLR